MMMPGCRSIDFDIDWIGLTCNILQKHWCLSNKEMIEFQFQIILKTFD